MKIVHIENHFHPDMGYQLNYFAEFHSSTMDFYLISSDSFSIWKGVDSEEILKNKDQAFEKKHNIKIIRLNSYSTKEGKHNIWIKNLFQTIEKISPDIIFTHALETLTSVRIIMSKLSRKYLVVTDTHTLMNQQVYGLKGFIYNSFLRNIYIPAINRKNILVFYTAEENKQILINIYGVKPQNIFPCLIGTNLKDYRFDEEAGREVREKLKIDLQTQLILYTGKLNNKKKPHLLLIAIKKIENFLENKIHLLAIGAKDQAYFEKYFQVSFSEMVQLSVLDSVANKELFKFYSAANFAVFPKENTLSSLDAQACKLPVIMEDDQTNRIRLKKGGLCYKKNDISDLGKKILLLINDQELLKKLSENGHNYIRNNFDYEKIVKQMENLFNEKLLNSKQVN